MSVRSLTATVELDTRDGALRASLRLVNRSGAPWLRAGGFAVGYQIFDPDSQLFIEDGVWQPLDGDVAPGESAATELSIRLPRENMRSSFSQRYAQTRLRQSLKMIPQQLYIPPAPLMNQKGYC